MTKIEKALEAYGEELTWLLQDLTISAEDIAASLTELGHPIASSTIKKWRRDNLA